MPPRTKKTSVSIDIDLLTAAERKVAERGFRYSMSAYICDLIRADQEADQAKPQNPSRPLDKPSRSKRQKISGS